MSKEVDAFFEHHGIKGMKWGVRKEEYRSANAVQKKQIRDNYDTQILNARQRRTMRYELARKAEDNYYQQKTTAGKKSAEKILQALYEERQTNRQSDNEWANRKTQSERKGNAIAASIIAGVGLVAIPVIYKTFD